MEEERDFVVFQDDDGNEFELDVIDYFDYEGCEYAILIDLKAAEDEGDDDDEVEQDVYIMKIVVNGDMEEFLPADEDKMDALAAIAEERLSECECDDDCECGDDCDCHEHDCDCGCGCHEHKD